MNDISTSKGTIYIRQLDRPELSRSDIRSAVASLLSEKLRLPTVEIGHSENGKPFIVGHEHLEFSVSHAKNVVAVYLSGEHPSGIDIECTHPQISKARSHFINSSEASHFEFSDEVLHLIWGAKEAVFKHFGGNFTDLSKEVSITHLGEDLISADTIHGKLACSYRIISGYYIVWT